MSKYKYMNEYAEHGQIVMIGDSLIDYYEVDEYYDNLPLRVYNRGIAGETSDHMLMRLVDDALSIEPNALFVEIGTNDMAKGVSMDDILDNITTAVDMAKKSNVRNIYLLSMCPINTTMHPSTLPSRNTDAIVFNGRLALSADALGVNFVNIFDTLKDDDNETIPAYTYDGVHPSAMGYDRITDVLMPYMISITK